jgi:uncharacterized protein YkwD
MVSRGLARRRPARYAFLILTLLLAALAAGCERLPPETIVAENYNQPTPLLPLSQAERLVVAMVGIWSAKAGREGPELDPGLTFVCRSLAERFRRAGVEDVSNFNNAFVQKEMFRYGVSDSSIRTQTGTAFRLSDLDAMFGAGVISELSSARYTHYGIGVVRSWWPPLYYVVVVFSRRPITLEPFPKRFEPGERATLAGALEEGLHGPEVLVSTPAGKIRQPTITLPGDGSFRATVYFDDGPGVYRVEVAADSSIGPEIAALMPVIVGEPDPNFEEAGPAPREDSEDKARALVVKQINLDRAAAKLKPLEVYGPLERVAQSHAEEMRQLRYAAHRSPNTGMVDDRASKAGIKWRRVGENVAVNQSALLAHESFMESPAHRANVLDAEVRYVGVGAAFADDGHGHRLVYLVENYLVLQGQ